MSCIETIKEAREELGRIIFLLENMKTNNTWIVSRLLSLKRTLEFEIRELEKK